MDAVVIGIIIAVIIAAIAVGVMKAQMRPVAIRREASQYEKDVTFSVKDDIYLRTERRVRPLQQAQSGAAGQATVAAGGSAGGAMHGAPRPQHGGRTGGPVQH